MFRDVFSEELGDLEIRAIHYAELLKSFRNTQRLSEESITSLRQDYPFYEVSTGDSVSFPWYYIPGSARCQCNSQCGTLGKVKLSGCGFPGKREAIWGARPPFWLELLETTLIKLLRTRAKFQTLEVMDAARKVRDGSKEWCCACAENMTYHWKRVEELAKDLEAIPIQ